MNREDLDYLGIKSMCNNHNITYTKEQFNFIFSNIIPIIMEDIALECDLPIFAKTYQKDIVRRAKELYNINL